MILNLELVLLVMTFFNLYLFYRYSRSDRQTFLNVGLKTKQNNESKKRITVKSSILAV